MSLSYDKSRNVATVKFLAPLKAGQWKASIWAGGVRDASGNNLDGNGDGKAGDHYNFTFTI